jgi:hypothetical protein
MMIIKRYALIWRTSFLYLQGEYLKRVEMEKKNEHVIRKLNQIKEWANGIIKESREMDRILESINKANPELSEYMMFVDVGDPKYGAELLISNIEDAIDDIKIFNLCP